MNKDKLCFHCGDEIVNEIVYKDKSFCCEGCKGVYQIINNAGLDEFYQVNNATEAVGTKVGTSYLDSLLDEKIADSLLSYKNNDYAIVSFVLPDIHCASCVWLLERLNQLNPNIIHSEIQFLKKRVTIRYDYHKTSLFDVAQLLQKIGYPPQFYRGETKKKDKSLLIKIGVAGFCFGNVMLLSFPDYVSEFTDLQLKDFFAYLSIILSLPVLFYCASIFYKNVYLGFKSKRLSIDFPIVLGIIALFTRSLYDIFILNEPGYLDSFTGLIFFLLLGKWFQSKVFDELSFERNAQDYLPLAILKKTADDFTITPLDAIKIGDTIKVRKNEIIPFDGAILSNNALIDYSFITGEVLPEEKLKNESIFCGGKVVGNDIEIAVSNTQRSNLFSLWQNNSSDKEISDKLIVAFTIIVVSLGIIAFGYHYNISGFQNAFIATTSVWIVACPCALALVQPTIWGTIIRRVAKHGIFLKSAKVVEKMKNVQNIVLDKTGTLTAKEYQCNFVPQDNLSLNIEQVFPYIYAIAQQANHALAAILLQNLAAYKKEVELNFFEELDAQGMTAQCALGNIKIGKLSYLNLPSNNNQEGKIEIWAQLNNELLGCFYIALEDRHQLNEILIALGKHNQTYLLSGDPNLNKTKYQQWIKPENIFSNQNPSDKKNRVDELKNKATTVMIGDGINDSLALQSADVGLAVVEQNGAFFPKCDGIILGTSLQNVPEMIEGIKKTNIIRNICFGFSFLYNSLGVYLAFNLQLTPLTASILMPVSTVTVIGLTIYLVKKSLRFKI